MAYEEKHDKVGNVYYEEDGVPVGGVIDKFTGEFLPDISAVSILPRVGAALVKIFQYLWRAIFTIPIHYWLPMMGQWLSFSSNFYARKLAKGFKMMGNKIGDSGVLPPEIKDTLQKMLESGDLSEMFSGALLSLPWYSSYILNTYGVMAKDNLYALNSKFTPTLLDAPMYTNLLFRQDNMTESVRKYMGFLGVSEENQSILKDTLKPLLRVVELAELRWRDIISESEFKKESMKFGYTSDDVDKLHKIIWGVPPVNDLVRFAVREAFSPEIINKYELGKDFPPDFAKAAKKVGITEEWAKRYWYAHWELPSIQMGFEMLHRGVINKDEIDLLLRTKDVMPYWRDKITDISYRPYSRVDVRRMHKAGVLGDSDVKQAYLDIGYNEERATKMMEFTILYNKGIEKSISKSDILGGFAENLVSQGDTLTELMDMGYSEDESQLLIKRTLFKKFKKAKELSLGQIKKLFFAAIYDETKVIEKLSGLRIQSEEMASILELWKLEKQMKVRTLPEPKLQQLLKGGIIKQATWIEEMSQLNYSKRHIEWLYKLYSGKDLN